MVEDYLSVCKLFDSLSFLKALPWYIDSCIRLLCRYASYYKLSKRDVLLKLNEENDHD